MDKGGRERERDGRGEQDVEKIWSLAFIAAW